MFKAVVTALAGAALGASLGLAQSPPPSAARERPAEAPGAGFCEDLRKRVRAFSTESTAAGAGQAGAELARCAKRADVPADTKASLLVDASAALFLAGDHTAAEGQLRDALASSRRGTHMGLRSDILTYLTVLETGKRNWKEAERLRREQEALGIGDDPRLQVFRAVNLGWAMLGQKKYGPAVRTLEEVVSLARSTGDRVLIALVDSRLGSAYAVSGREHEGEALLRRALATQEQLSGVERKDLGPTLLSLAELLGRGGRNRESEAVWARAVREMDEYLGPEHPELAVYLEGWSKALKALGDGEGARQAHGRAVAVEDAAAARRGATVHVQTLASDRR